MKMPQPNPPKMAEQDPPRGRPLLLIKYRCQHDQFRDNEVVYTRYIPACAVVDSVVSNELAVDRVVAGPDLEAGAHAAAFAVVAVPLVQRAPRDWGSQMIDLIMIVRDSAGSGDGGKRQERGDVKTHVVQKAWMTGEDDWKTWCCSGVERGVEKALRLLIYVYS